MFLGIFQNMALLKCAPPLFTKYKTSFATMKNKNQTKQTNKQKIESTVSHFPFSEYHRKKKKIP